MVTIPKRVKKMSQNQIYGLEYRHIAIKREDVERLTELKEATGQSYTALIAMAIELFLKQAKPAA